MHAAYKMVVPGVAGTFCLLQVKQATVTSPSLASETHIPSVPMRQCVHQTCGTHSRNKSQLHSLPSNQPPEAWLLIHWL